MKYNKLRHNNNRILNHIRKKICVIYWMRSPLLLFCILYTKYQQINRSL